jgi:tyrosine-protein kinase Etk/Wzc
MTAGTPAQQPAELLASPVFGEMLQILRSDYDRIVIDSVPVLAVADVLLIAEHAELVCLVVRAAKTSRKCVLRARDTLINAGVKPAGVLLNQLVFRSGSGYNRYIGKYGAPENYGKERKRESDLEEVTPSNRNGEA